MIVISLHPSTKGSIIIWFITVLIYITKSRFLAYHSIIKFWLIYIVYIHSDRWNKLTKNQLYYTVRKNAVVIQTGCPHYTTKIPYLQYIIPNLKYLIAKFSTCSFYSLNKTKRTEHTALQVCLILKYHKDYGGEKLLNKVRK